MRLFVLTTLCTLHSLLFICPAPAQVFIGHLSYDSVLCQMDSYVLARQQLATIRAQYDAEQKRVEQEFNQKYEEFLDSQSEFPETILRKRQTELKEFMERNIAFKAEARQLIAQAEDSIMAPLRQQLTAAIAAVAHEMELIVVVNTDANACPFIHPELSVDISREVIQRLKNTSP